VNRDFSKRRMKMDYIEHGDKVTAADRLGINEGASPLAKIILYRQRDKVAYRTGNLSKDSFESRYRWYQAEIRKYYPGINVDNPPPELIEEAKKADARREKTPWDI
jgi:hypothetical protein